MSFWLWGSLLAFAGGVGISCVNYAVSRLILQKKPAQYSYCTILRQALNVGYFVLLYLLAPHTPWDAVYRLVGGALGVTLPMIFFTGKLLKLSDSLNRQSRDSVPKEEKEADANG